MGEADLARGGGGLFFFEPQTGALEAEMVAPDRDRARRDDQHLLTPGARSPGGIVLDQRREPGALQIAAAVIDEERRADLDDETAGAGKALARDA